MPMKEYMKFPSNTQVGQKEQKTSHNNSALTQEINRALEMMKRVKKSNIVQFENTSESERMPSYLLPDSVILCQTTI